MAQKTVLGKGLASLLPGVSVPPAISSGAISAGPPASVPQAEVGNRDRHPGISLANVDEIVTNQYQPRRDFDDAALEELAQSIRSNGIIQPLVVRKTSQGYQLIAGERRLRAAKRAGLKQVPVVIRRSTDREALELALIENIQRQNLNCIDEALAYFQLLQEFSLTQEEISVRVGKERATVANYLRLLKLPEAIIDDLKRHVLSFGHGKALLSVEDTDIRLHARAQIVEKHLSVREAEALVEELKRRAAESSTSNTSDQAHGAQASESSTPIQSRLARLAHELTHHWSTKVDMRGSERRGKIVIHYSSRQELDRILAKMHNEKV